MSRWPVGQNLHWKLQALAGSTKTTNGVSSGMTVSSGVRPSRLIRGFSCAFIRTPVVRQIAPAVAVGDPLGKGTHGQRLARTYVDDASLAAVDDIGNHRTGLTHIEEVADLGTGGKVRLFAGL